MSDVRVHTSGTDTTPLLTTPSGTYVDAVDYSDHDLVVFARHLDAWWYGLADGAADALSDLAGAHAALSAEFAASIGSRTRSCAGAASALAAHESSRAFFPVRGPAEQFCRRSQELLAEGAARARATRRGTRGTSGHVDGVYLSDGGVPKRAVDGAEVGFRGLAGDRQRNRVHHGRPFQALCLWSAECVEALQAEGHPIRPGAAGENLELRGFDWSAMRTGDRLQIGTALIELTFPATPCSTIAGCFTDRTFTRIDHDRHPGWSRLYASVIAAGSVSVGDVARVAE